MSVPHHRTHAGVPPLRRPRRGTLYVAVMGVTMIVGVLALVGGLVGRLELKRTAAREQQQLARRLAIEGVEYGFNWIQKNPAWRAELTSGVESPPFYPEGEGDFRIVATDPDGDLADDPEGGLCSRASAASATPLRAKRSRWFSPASRWTASPLP